MRAWCAIEAVFAVAAARGITATEVENTEHSAHFYTENTKTEHCASDTSVMFPLFSAYSYKLNLYKLQYHKRTFFGGVLYSHAFNLSHAQASLFEEGLSWNNQNELRKAADCYTKAINVDPEHTESMVIIIITIICVCAFARPGGLVLLTLPIFSLRHTPQHNLAVLYNSHGQAAQAEELYRMCLKVDPRSFDTINNLAVLLLEQGTARF
jgi:tetratricopeptide (TPR) repeat protein